MNIDDFEKLTKEELTTLFIEENRTAAEICSMFSISTSTFSRALTKFNIKKSAKLARQISIKTAFYISKDELYKLVYEDNLSKKQIYKHLNICIGTLNKFLKRYKISLKDRNNRDVINLSCDKVYELYVKNNKTLEEVANILNVSVPTIIRFCRKYNITKPNELKRELRRELAKTEKLRVKKICKNCGKEYIGYITSSFCCEKCRNHYSRFGSIPESGYRICKNCGKRYYYTKNEDLRRCNNSKHGYNSYDVCSYECGAELHVKATSKTIKEKYGVDNISKLQEIKDKKSETLFKNYGVKGTMSNPEIKAKIMETRELHKEEISETYINLWKNRTPEEISKMSEKRRQTNKEKYGVNWIFELEDETWDEKRYKTHKKNNSFKTSMFEEKVAKEFDNKNIKYERQYRSELYPFMCDFYIPSIDLYIEIQGHWSHGKNSKKVLGAFDKDNIEHIKILNLWKERSINSESYESAINVWTIRDPLKREIAKKNNLNWIEFFTFKDFKIWLDSLSDIS